MTISEFLEHVDRALPRSRFKLNAIEIAPPHRPSADPKQRPRAQQSPGYTISVLDARTGKRLEFTVTRDELATDARGEWQASVIARAVKETSYQPDRACAKP